MYFYLMVLIPLVGLLIPFILIKQNHVSNKKKIASFLFLPGLEIFLLISLFIKQGMIYNRNGIIELAITIIALNLTLAFINLRYK